MRGCCDPLCPTGIERFCRDIVTMICRCPPWYSRLLGCFKVCWVFLTPCLLLVSAGRCLSSSWSVGQPGWPWGPHGAITALLPPPSSQFTLIYTFLEMYSVPLCYGTYEFPAWGTSLGVCMGVLSCVQIPIGAVVALCHQTGTLSDVSVNWGGVGGWGGMGMGWKWGWDGGRMGMGWD